MYNPDIHSVRSGNTFTLTLATPVPEKVGGSMDYNDMTNKPSINGKELTGDMSLEDLGIRNKPLTAADIDAIIDEADKE